MPILKGDGAKGHEAIYGWEKQTQIEQVPPPLPPTPRALAGASHAPWTWCWGGNQPVGFSERGSGVTPCLGLAEAPVRGEGLEQLLRRNLKRFRVGLVVKTHRLVYHSTLGWRVIKKKKKKFSTQVSVVVQHQHLQGRWSVLALHRDALT